MDPYNRITPSFLPPQSTQPHQSQYTQAQSSQERKLVFQPSQGYPRQQQKTEQFQTQATSFLPSSQVKSRNEVLPPYNRLSNNIPFNSQNPTYGNDPIQVVPLRQEQTQRQEAPPRQEIAPRKPLFDSNPKEIREQVLETRQTQPATDVEAQLKKKTLEAESLRRQLDRSNLEKDQLKQALEHMTRKYQQQQQQMQMQMQMQHQNLTVNDGMDHEEKLSLMIAMQLQQEEQELMQQQQREVEKQHRRAARERLQRNQTHFLREAFEYSPLMTVRHDPSQINPDRMSYEELLELQDKIGHVNKGLSEQQISRIHSNNVRKYNLTQLPENCTICCSNFQENEQFTRLLCSHVYHSPCIKKWLGTQKTCPICKEEVLPGVE